MNLNPARPRTAILTAALLLALAACGKESAQPGPDESTSTADSAIGTTTPGTTSPGATGSGTTDLGTTSPGVANPTTNPGTTGPGSTGPGTNGPGSTGPGATRSSQPTVASKPTKTPTSTGIVVPVITFRNQTIEFRRHSLALKATITPKGPIRFRVLPGGPGTNNDGQCNIVDGRLKLWNPHVSVQLRDLVPPALLTACIIEAYAPAAPGRAAATPRRALVTVWYPTFDVSVDPYEIDWSVSKQVTVAVREGSGAAYQVYVGQEQGSAGDCTGGRSPAEDNSAPGTRRYEVTVVAETVPGPEGYTCSMFARAGPVNIAGSSKDVSFKIKVIP